MPTYRDDPAPMPKCVPRPDYRLCGKRASGRQARVRAGAQRKHNKGTCTCGLTKQGGERS